MLSKKKGVAVGILLAVLLLVTGTRALDLTVTGFIEVPDR